MKTSAGAFVIYAAMNLSPALGQSPVDSAIVAAQGSTMTGSIVGCIRDTTQQPLPGATVVATGNVIQRSTVTDVTGCYELKRSAAGAVQGDRTPGSVRQRHARSVDRRSGRSHAPRPHDAPEPDLRVCQCAWKPRRTLGSCGCSLPPSTCGFRARAIDATGVLPTLWECDSNTEAARRVSFARRVCSSEPAERDAWPLRRWTRAGGVHGVVGMERVSDHERRARVGRRSGKRFPCDCLSRPGRSHSAGAARILSLSRNVYRFLCGGIARDISSQVIRASRPSFHFRWHLFHETNIVGTGAHRRSNTHTLS